MTGHHSLCTLDQQSFAVPLFDNCTKFEFAGYTGGIWAPQERRYLLPDKHTEGTILPFIGKKLGLLARFYVGNRRLFLFT